MLLCSLIAVLWQIGLLRLLGLGLDPFSVLVPFLIFAIGVSHGAQKMNGIQQDVGRGTVTLVAARYTFRRLFVAGVTALLNGAAGFAVLLLIPIPAIRELAIAATIGVCVLLFTNLVLLPVILSFTGVSKTAATRSLKQEEQGIGTKGIWEFINHFAERRSWATVAVVVALALGAAGHVVSTGLQIGDLDPGAPELRANSRYNVDNAFITSSYALSSDVFAVDREDAARAVHAVRHPPAGRPPGVAAAAAARGAGHGIAGRFRRASDGRHLRRLGQVVHAVAQPGDPELRRAAGDSEHARPHQRRVLGDSGHRLSEGSQGRDARQGIRDRREVHCATTGR